MENIVWLIFLLLIFILSIKLMIHQRFKTLNVFKLFKDINSDSMSSLCMFLGTKIGVGSLVGTTIAIYIGGHSTILWIILFTFLTSPIVYEEARLGFKYREKIDDSYISGPNFYIKRKLLKLLYIILFLISYTFFFLMIQTNTITNLIDINMNVNKLVLFVFFFVLLTNLLIFDLKSVVVIMDKLVILMCIILLLLFTYVFITDFGEISVVIKSVFNDFLSLKSSITGLITSLIISIKRSVFQTELLLGTTSVSAALSKGSEEVASSTAVLGFYFVSFFISVSMAFLVITYDINSSVNIDNYFMLMSNVFKYHFGQIGVFFMIVLCLLFGITTIIGAYYFGINNVKRIKKSILKIYKFLMLAFPLCGILINEGIIWKLVDVVMLLLMMINLIEIFRLKEVKYDRK